MRKENDYGLEWIGDHQFENLADGLQWTGTEEELMEGLKRLARERGILKDDDP